jgi:hypothetical protein
VARIITKELAEKIHKKLKATPAAGKRNTAHDEYDVIHNDQIIGTISIHGGHPRTKDTTTSHAI